MEIDLINTKKEIIGQKSLDDKVFGADINKGALHICVVSHLANIRRGTHACKGRALVKGSGRKPWRQKGTGNARAGSVKSPLWRGGGVTFGPIPRDYSFKVNKKVMKAAMKSALSLKVKNGQMLVLDKIELERPKTKDLAVIINGLGSKRKTMFVLDKENRNLTLAARNMPCIRVQRIETFNLFDVMAYDNLVFTSASVDKIQMRFAG